MSILLERVDDHPTMSTAASPSIPARRLSSRRGSMIAPDPFGQHDVPQPLSSSSRITIVRVPSQPSSPAVGSPREAGHGRRDRGSADLARRSSWGSNHSASSSLSMPGRMSFAFSSFTPINPTTSTGHTPPASPTYTRSRRSNSNPSLYQMNTNVHRPNQMTPQQIVDAARSATSNAGSSSGAAFTALPSEVYLPFIHRPQEVTQLIATPQTSRLFALLASTFPQEPASRPSSRASHAQSTTSSLSANYTFAELPEDPRTWTFSQLTFWLKCVTRQEANDKEWTRKIRLCINNRSEVLWQRFAGALGVPAGFDEEDDSALADEEDMDIDAMASRFSRHSFLGSGRGSVGSRAEIDLKSNPTDPGDAEQELEDEYDDLDNVSVTDSVIVEPIFPSTTPAPGLGLANVAGSSSGVLPSSASTTSLKDLAEVAEEDEGEEENPTSEGKDKGKESITEDTTGSGAATPSTSINPSAYMDVPKDRWKNSRSPSGHLLPHLRDHSPRSPSPLIESSSPADAKSDDTKEAQKSLEEATEDATKSTKGPALNLITSTPDPSADAHHHHASSSSSKNVRIATEPTYVPSTSPAEDSQSQTDSSAAVDSEIDFPENPDPNAEPIQGLRITNAPLMYLSNNSAADAIPAHHPLARRLSESATTTTRDARRRPQSFGQMMQMGMTGGAGLMNNRPYNVNAERGPGNPLFPTSFAGLSIGPTLGANNPQLRNPVHPPASAFPEHWVPRLGGGARRRPPSWAGDWPQDGHEYAVTVASGSSDRG
ncbi:hypothetical protein FRC02_001885 [Tulasnella sp. 418]|nr:hypothetical protein FRC02_001885 [Tulasnella sp. 418]